MHAGADPGLLTTFISGTVRGVEALGVLVILVGIVAATVGYVRRAGPGGNWSQCFGHYRADLGRGILLGLEFLVAADIIATVSAPLTFESVGVLALVVLIRTFLSFALETEIEGQWPWRRSEHADDRRR